MRGNLLLFTPSLDRTGSEIVFVNFLLYSGIEQFYTIKLVSLKRGALIDKIQSKCEIVVYEDFYAQQAKVIQKIKHKFEKNKDYQLIFYDRVFSDFSPDVVYINGLNVANTKLLSYLLNARFSKEKIVLYSHETFVALNSIDSLYIDLVKSTVGKFMACSLTSAHMLKVLFCYEPTISYPGIDASEIDSHCDNTGIFNLDDLSNDQKVWAMSGYSDFNKDPIFFIQLYKELLKRNHKVYFIWLGANNSSGFTQYCKALIRSQGLPNIKLMENLPPAEYYSLLRRIDGFVLTSFYDSFPTVMLEAAYLGKPIVSHDSGGAGEFLRENGKELVCSKTISEYADKIESYNKNDKESYNISEYIMPLAAEKWVQSFNRLIEA
ncbi:MAG: glycosyltransferase [Cyclobacteriaceae bacterium]